MVHFLNSFVANMCSIIICASDWFGLILLCLLVNLSSFMQIIFCLAFYYRCVTIFLFMDSFTSLIFVYRKSTFHILMAIKLPLLSLSIFHLLVSILGCFLF